MEKKKTSNIFKRILAKKRILIGGLVLLIAFFVVRSLFFSKNKGNEKTDVKRGTVSEELVLSGAINADEYAQLTYPTSGRISWVGVKEGEWVKKGQSLAKLDTTYLNSSYQQSLSDLRSAQASLDNIYDQLKGHEKDESYSQRDTRTAYEAAKDKAYENYVKALDNLKNSTLTAPFEGLITYVAHPYSGVNIMLTETQIEIINPATIFFDVSGDQNDVINISNDQKVNIVLDSISDENLEGVVDFISYTPKQGEVGTVYRIKVRFLKSDFDSKKYRIGMSGDAKFILHQIENVLYVPPKYIKTDSQGKYLKLGSNNNKKYIEVGIEGEERVEVKGDIKEGETIYN